eukprot:TRINITY_DN1827_c0_g1_i1.p1 TRINITY_DN1827_c0_g1~~TRINITY_DN1827_c0_g1_i1.p1  ORF type:complete len:138 (+),score=32.84 TRINITY_DN1827_c0_g1_i1:303-716(+)
MDHSRQDAKVDTIGKDDSGRENPNVDLGVYCDPETENTNTDSKDDREKMPISQDEGTSDQTMESDMCRYTDRAPRGEDVYKGPKYILEHTGINDRKDEDQSLPVEEGDLPPLQRRIDHLEILLEQMKQKMLNKNRKL